MRQVPHFLLIGSGRLASHLAHYFSSLHISYSQWSRRHHNIADLFRLCETATHLLLLVNDNAIAELAEQTQAFHKKIRVHCSGHLVLPDVFSAHPLFTFTPELYIPNFYHHIPFIIEEDGPDFAELLPGLPNPNFKISSELKEYYHAMCVMSGNFTTILWQKFFYELEHKFNLPAQVAQPYLKQITLNLITNPESALTGPLVRNDQTTIKNNLTALEQDAFQEVYQAFINSFSKQSMRKI